MRAGEDRAGVAISWLGMPGNRIHLPLSAESRPPGARAQLPAQGPLAPTGPACDPHPAAK